MPEMYGRREETGREKDEREKSSIEIEKRSERFSQWDFDRLLTFSLRTEQSNHFLDLSSSIAPSLDVLLFDLCLLGRECGGWGLMGLSWGMGGWVDLNEDLSLTAILLTGGKFHFNANRRVMRRRTKLANSKKESTFE